MAVLSTVGCNDRVVRPPRQWPSPVEIVERMGGNCVLVEGRAHCWAMGSPDDPRDEEDDALSRMLMLRDALFPGSPLPALSLGEGPVTGFSTGFLSRCAILGRRRIKCWGDNGAAKPDNVNEHYSLGQPDLDVRLGDDSAERGSALPFVDLGAVGELVRVQARGGSGYCALDGRGRIKCWGSRPESLGLGDTKVRGDDPGEMGDALPFVDLGTDFVAAGLSVGGYHACAWTEAGEVKCWGNNLIGQLGIEPIGEILGDAPGEMGDALPFVDLGTGVRVQQVVAGALYTCALTKDGRVKCWGATELPPPDPLPDGYDERPWGGTPLLGLGDAVGRAPPLGDALEYVDLGTHARVVALNGGSTAMCALLDVGSLKCWGHNTKGQLGQGDDDRRGDDPGEMGDALPVIDLGEGRTVQSFTGGNQPCALLDDNSIKCWGGLLTGAGELPDTMGDNLVPVVTAQDLGLDDP